MSQIVPSLVVLHKNGGDHLKTAGRSGKKTRDCHTGITHRRKLFWTCINVEAPMISAVRTIPAMMRLAILEAFHHHLGVGGGL